MTESDSARERKTYVVDTSILVSTPDALQNLTTRNTVVLPFPVLQELDRRLTGPIPDLETSALGRRPPPGSSYGAAYPRLRVRR